MQALEESLTCTWKARTTVPGLVVIHPNGRTLRKQSELDGQDQDQPSNKQMDLKI